MMYLNDCELDGIVGGAVGLAVALNSPQSTYVNDGNPSTGFNGDHVVTAPAAALGTGFPKAFGNITANVGNLSNIDIVFNA